MKTYYVTQEQLELIDGLKSFKYPLNPLLKNLARYSSLNANLSEEEEKALLRYLGGDESIEFKIKEQLYRLWRIDDRDNRVYMQINGFGTPIWTTRKHEAFTATREEIVSWINPAWKIEEVD